MSAMRMKKICGELNCSDIWTEFHGVEKEIRDKDSAGIKGLLPTHARLPRVVAVKT